MCSSTCFGGISSVAFARKIVDCGLSLYLFPPWFRCCDFFVSCVPAGSVSSSSILHIIIARRKLYVMVACPDNISAK